VTLCDTHCHLYMDRFDSDRQEAIARAVSVGVRRMLVPGVDLGSSEQSVELAQAFEPIYAGVGFHPTEIHSFNSDALTALRHLAASGKVAAIGEVGLDYYWVTDPGKQREQQGLLRSQLDLAAEVGLPVVLHMREEKDAIDGPCASDLLDLLRDWATDARVQRSRLSGCAGVLHSFSGTAATARTAMDLGFYIGITGPVTYPRATARHDVVRQIPLDRILIETDSPYLAPSPHRGTRNEPAFVASIADKIASIQARTSADVADVTSRNAARLFAWGESL